MSDVHFYKQYKILVLIGFQYSSKSHKSRLHPYLPAQLRA